MSLVGARAARVGCALAFALATAAPAGDAAAVLPAASLYQLRLSLESAGGDRFELGDQAGRPIVITLFYASCTSVCPLLTLTLQRLERALGPDERARVRFVMVSLDGTRDEPAALTAFAADHGLDGAGWLLARAAPADVRTLAAALGIRYRRLPDGSYSHASLLTLLDARGVPRARSSLIGEVDREFLARLRAELR